MHHARAINIDLFPPSLFLILTFSLSPFLITQDLFAILKKMKKTPPSVD
jgi:hypothetical protein